MNKIWKFAWKSWPVVRWLRVCIIAPHSVAEGLQILGKKVAIKNFKLFYYFSVTYCFLRQLIPLFYGSAYYCICAYLNTRIQYLLSKKLNR